MDKMIERCPFCGGEHFFVDWSSLDKVTEPHRLSERHICKDCGRKVMQNYEYEGWSNDDSSGKGYPLACVSCGCEELSVDYGGLDDLDSSFLEDYRCDSCGMRYHLHWRPLSWEVLEEEGFKVEVLPHEREVIEEEAAQ